MDPPKKDRNKSRSRCGFLKVNLSAVSFSESSAESSGYLPNFGELCDKILKPARNSNGALENTPLCNSSSCYVVFSIRLLSKSRALTDYWTLVSESITRPIFVKYKQNTRGFVTFLINHTEPLRFVSPRGSDSVIPVEEAVPHFDALLNANEFLLSFGISIVKKSKVLYVGYGRKPLEASELFGKRLAIEVVEDTKNNNALKFRKGYLFFDVYAKRTHLVPGAHCTEPAETKPPLGDHLEEKLKGLLSDKGNFADAARDTDFLKDVRLEDYTSSSSVLDSVSDLSSVINRPVKSKPKGPPKNESAPIATAKRPDPAAPHDALYDQNDSGKTAGSCAGDNGEALNGRAPDLSRRPGRDVHLYAHPSGCITHTPDFVKVAEFAAARRYSGLSHSGRELLDVLNLDTHRLGKEGGKGFSGVDFSSNVVDNRVVFKVFLRFANAAAGRNSEAAALDEVLTRLFLFYDKVFLAAGGGGSYEVLWIKTRSVDCLENTIKVPIASCRDKIGELLAYLSKIEVSSVLGVAILVRADVDVVRFGVYRSILEQKLKAANGLDVPMQLTEAVFGLDFAGFQPFSGGERPEPPPEARDVAQPPGPEEAPPPAEPAVEPTSARVDVSPCQEKPADRQPSSCGKLASLMKKEVDAIKHEDSIPADFFRFIWPSYSKQLA